MPNKFGTLGVFIWEFMIEQIFRNSYKEYFFARTVSKLAQFTPFASINIPSKRELLIISAKCLPLYCASITSIYSLLAVAEDFFLLSVSFWNDLADPAFDGVGLAGFKSRANIFFIGLSCSIPTIVFYYFSIFLLSVYMLVLWGWGLRTDRVYITLSQPCTADLF